MSAVAVRLYRRASPAQRLHALALLAYAGVFLVLVVAARPGLGIGQGFYIPIILVALVGTATAGIAAGVAASALYELALVVDGATGGALLSMRAGIHLATYVVGGGLVGYFATRARSMLSEALHVLDELLRLARRDVGTGLLDRDGLDRALAERIAAGAPFTLAIAEIDSAERDDASLRRAARALLGQLGPDTEIACIGPAHLAVVTGSTGPAAARAGAQALERAIDADGGRATFGWALHPREGTDTWTLFRAATERLYARRIVRGEWTPTAASAGLVDELSRRE